MTNTDATSQLRQLKGSIQRIAQHLSNAYKMDVDEVMYSDLSGIKSEYSNAEYLIENYPVAKIIEIKDMEGSLESRRQEKNLIMEIFNIS